MEETPQTPNEPVDPPPAEPAEQAAPVESTAPVASDDDKNLAVLAHALGFLTWIGPLIIFLIKNEAKGSFARQEAVESLNFQITVLIVYIVMGITCILAPFTAIVWVVQLVFCILGAVKASKGEAYRYPLAIRLIK